MQGVPRHIISASGSKIHYYGVREVKFKVWGKDDTKAKFVVADVTRPILSVGSLNRKGIRASFDAELSLLKVRAKEYELIQHRNLFYLPVKVLESSGCDDQLKEAL